jgi:hypothetical protein
MRTSAGNDVTLTDAMVAGSSEGRFTIVDEAGDDTVTTSAIAAGRLLCAGQAMPVALDLRHNAIEAGWRISMVPPHRFTGVGEQRIERTQTMQRRRDGLLPRLRRRRLSGPARPLQHQRFTR